MKRKIALLLAVIMLMSLLPTQVFANTGSASIHGELLVGQETDTRFTHNGIRGPLGTAIPVNIARTARFDLPATAIVGDWELVLTLSNATWVSPSNATLPTMLPNNANNLWGSNWEQTNHHGIGSGDHGGSNVANNNFMLESVAEDLEVRVSPLNPSQAIVSGTGNANISGAFHIPVVSRLTNQDSNATLTATVRRPVGSTETSVLPNWGGTFEIARTGEVVGGTTVEAVGRITGRFEFTLDRLVIRETRPNTLFIGDGTEFGRFYIEAPTGFSFAGNFTTGQDLQVFGVGFVNNVPTATVVDGPAANDSRRIQIDLPVDPADMPVGVLRTISIEDISIQGVNANMGDFSLRLFNATRIAAQNVNPARITNTSVVAGTASNWAMSFERSTPARDSSMTMPAIPNLITGRFDLQKANLLGDNNRIGVDNFTFAGTNVTDMADTVNATHTYNEQNIFGEFAQGVNAQIDSNALSNRVARVRLREEVINTFLRNRETIFTLPEGVNFLRVDFVRTDGLDNISNGNMAFNSFTDARRPVDSSGTTISGSGVSDMIILNDNRMEWINFERVDDQTRVDIELDIWVSISPTFAPADGSIVDIELEISGPGVPELESVVIATAQRPITIETTVTDVSIGFQRIEMADVIVRETIAGVLREDMQVLFGLEQPEGTYFSGLTLTSGNVAVTDGDLEINVLPTARHGFTVESPSTEASSITLSNVAITVDRTTPFTNDRPFEFRVGGNAVVRNSGVGAGTPNTVVGRRRTGLFGVNHFAAPYADVTTPPQEPLRAEVRVAAGQNFMYIDGERSETFDAAPFNHDGTMMIPIRFISYALGIPSESVHWANGVGGAGGIVTITAPNNRIVRFQVGSSMMTINGGEVPMVDANGRAVYAQNVNERVFIPFRQIGTALDVPVSWDAEAGQAIFNAR